MLFTIMFHIYITFRTKYRFVELAQSTKAKLNNHLVVGELTLQFQNMPLPFPYYHHPPPSLSLSLSMHLHILAPPSTNILFYTPFSFFVGLGEGGECPRVMMDQQRVILEVT